MVEINVPVATEAVPLGKVASPQAMTEGVSAAEAILNRPTGRKGGLAMRSREPWRLPAGQSRAVPFLQAAVLFAALCIFARSAALVLAAFLAAPVPAAQTLLHLGQQAVESRAAASAESVPEDVSAPSPAQEADVPVQTGVEQYFVALQPDEARPADAGTVTEQQFGHGSGEKYIPCGAGSRSGS